MNSDRDHADVASNLLITRTITVVDHVETGRAWAQMRKLMGVSAASVSAHLQRTSMAVLLMEGGAIRWTHALAKTYMDALYIEAGAKKPPAQFKLRRVQHDDGF